MSLWGLVFIASTALAALGFVAVAVLWLKKLRETLASALGETANQQIKTAQRFSDTLAEMNKRQQLYEQRLQTLTEANIKMRQDMNEMASRLELTDSTGTPPARQRVLH